MGRIGAASGADCAGWSWRARSSSIRCDSSASERSTATRLASRDGSGTGGPDCIKKPITPPIAADSAAVSRCADAPGRSAMRGVLTVQSLPLRQAGRWAVTGAARRNQENAGQQQRAYAVQPKLRTYTNAPAACDHPPLPAPRRVAKTHRSPHSRSHSVTCPEAQIQAGRRHQQFGV